MSAIPHVGHSPTYDRRRVVGPAAYPHARVRVRRKSERWADVARFGVFVLLLTSVLHFVAGFTGQLLIEECRRAAIRSNARAERAEIATAALRRDLDELQSASRVEQWAALNGYESSFVVSNETPAN